MEAILIFSTIFLVITLINYKMMQKEVTEGSTCQDEINEVKNNWKWHKIFLYGSIIGVVIGLIGTIIQFWIL
jgi:hypothetical protein